MRNHVRLAALLPAIAGAAIAAACSESTDEPYDLDVCTGTQHALLEGVTPAEALDYSEIRQDSSDAEVQPLVFAKAGTPCASAHSVETCERDLAAFRSEAGWEVGRNGLAPENRRYLVFTAQDRIG